MDALFCCRDDIVTCECVVDAVGERFLFLWNIEISIDFLSVLFFWVDQQFAPFFLFKKLLLFSSHNILHYSSLSLRISVLSGVQARNLGLLELIIEFLLN